MTTLVYETGPRSPRFDPGGPDVLEQIAAATAAGFTAVTVDEWTLAAGADGETIAAALGAAGLRCAGLVALRANERVAPTESARRLLATVRALRPGMVLTAIEVDPSPGVIEDLALAARLLADEGARLAIEFIPFRVIRDLATARWLAGEVGSGAGVCLDTWHFFRGSEAQWDELAATDGREITYIQFSDALPLESADLLTETSTRRTYPGEGEFDLERFAAAVREIGYDGDVGLEVLSERNRLEGAEEFARHLYQSTARYWPDGG